MARKRKGAPPTAEALIRAAQESAADRKEELRKGTAWFDELSQRTAIADPDITRELPVLPIDTADTIKTMDVVDTVTTINTMHMIDTAAIGADSIEPDTMDAVNARIRAFRQTCQGPNPSPLCHASERGSSSK